MAPQTITARKEVEGVKKDAVISFDFGKDLDEAREKFGDEVVFSNFKGAAVITAQAAMRRRLEQGKSAEQIAEEMKSWKPGVALARGAADPAAALLAKFGGMDAKEQQDLIAQLREKAAGGKAGR